MQEGKNNQGKLNLTWYIIDRNFKAAIINMYENLWENIVLINEQMAKQQQNRMKSPFSSVCATLTKIP